MEEPSTDIPKYKLHGSNSSLPLLVYIAGMDGTGELFYKQIPALSEDYRVVTFRLRDKPDATFEDLTDDVAAIIRDLNESKAFIVGESFGGTIAMTFAIRYPAMTDHLVIVNSFPYYRGRFRINLAAGLASIVTFQVALPFRLAMASLGLWMDGVTREDRRRILKALHTIEIKSYARRLWMISEVNLIERLAEIQAPTLFIAATYDLLVPSVREARFMQSRVPNATVKIIKGAGHACLLGSRLHLNELLAAWLASERQEKVGTPV